MNHIRNQRTRKPVTFEDLILTAASRCHHAPATPLFPAPRFCGSLKVEVLG